MLEQTNEKSVKSVGEETWRRSIGKNYWKKEFIKIGKNLKYKWVGK